MNRLTISNMGLKRKFLARDQFKAAGNQQTLDTQRSMAGDEATLRQSGTSKP